jgi:hypothetical protein
MESTKFLDRFMRSIKIKARCLVQRARLREHLNPPRNPAEGEGSAAGSSMPHHFRVPLLRGPKPAAWWGEPEDRSLLIGSLKYGFTEAHGKVATRQMEQIRSDRSLVFGHFDW